MKKIANWFRSLKPRHQVALVSTIGSAIILGIFSLITAFINARESVHNDQITNNQQAIVIQEEIKRPEYKQHPEVKRINLDVFEYLKQIDKQTDEREIQRLINIVFGFLEESCETDPDDGETYYLFAEAYLRNNDYDKAMHYYDIALQKQFFYESDIYYGYGYSYEAVGDQKMAINDLPSADVYYKHSINNLNIAVNEQFLFYRNIEEIQKLISRVEFKILTNDYTEEYFTLLNAISKDSNNSNNISLMNELAIKCADLKMWKNSLRCYYWLFKQNILGQRRIGIMRDFQYISGLWEFSDDFVNDISINSVKAIINSEYVNFRYEPIIENNIIREFELYEEVQILQRSDFRQNIGNVRTFWYKICTDDNSEGWVYGEYLWFYPNFTF
jgi:tetratricopeptide (TPR) repeat protein